MQTALLFPVSPGDVKWGILLMVFLGVILLAAAWKSWREYKKVQKKRHLVVLVVCFLFALSMIPCEMLLRSYTSATIALRETGVWVQMRPMLEDQGLAYKDIANYQTTSITHLGGLGKSSGYSDGHERVGWFTMHRNGRKVYACSVGDEVLLIEGKKGDILLLAPPDSGRFLAEFERRVKEHGWNG